MKTDTHRKITKSLTNLLAGNFMADLVKNVLVITGLVMTLALSKVSVAPNIELIVLASAMNFVILGLIYGKISSIKNEVKGIEYPFILKFPIAVAIVNAYSHLAVTAITLT